MYFKLFRCAFSTLQSNNSIPSLSWKEIKRFTRHPNRNVLSVPSSRCQSSVTSVVKPETKAKTKTPKTSSAVKKTRNLSQTEELTEYFEKKGNVEVMKSLPVKILRKKRTPPEALYLVDRDVAKLIVNRIQSSVKRGDLPVLEANPGLGYISEELLAAGVSNLRLFETATTFFPHIQALKAKHPDCIEVQSTDLLTLYRQAFQDKLDNGTRVDDALRGISKRNWSDDPCMKIIATLPTVNFIKHLIVSFMLQNGIMMRGRPELYLIMSPPLFIHLTCDSSAGYLQYRSTTVLFQLIFQTQLLEKLPRKAFLPWEVAYSVSKKSKLAKVHKIDPDCMYLVKVEPRRNFLEDVVSTDKLQPLSYFIRHNMLSRKNRVIPNLEKWIPGCGPRLIVGGMNIFTQFGDLTPREMLAVFNEFVSWPEYADSPFLPSMEHNFMKMESSAESLDKELQDEQPDDDEGTVAG